ncbi:MAG: RsmE family RNA methyltransferase, partial [Anaerolineae bacterium]
WEEEQHLSMRSLLREAPPGREKAWPPFTINLFIGPEGGFTVEEIAVARRYDVVPVTLGSRTLRSETAAIAASAAVLYELGDMA